MATLDMIETKAKHYAAARADLHNKLASLHNDVEHAKRRAMPRIKELVGEAKVARAALHAAITASPELFEGTPRTQILHGIKVGFQKAKGKISWKNVKKVVAAIREQLPGQFKVLVKVDEKPRKKALQALSAEQLKKLGIEVSGSGDEVVISDTVTDVDKLVDAFLEEGEEEVEA